MAGYEMEGAIPILTAPTFSEGAISIKTAPIFSEGIPRAQGGGHPRKWGSTRGDLRGGGSGCWVRIADQCAALRKKREGDDAATRQSGLKHFVKKRLEKHLATGEPARYVSVIGTQDRRSGYDAIRGDRRKRQYILF